MAFIDQKHKPNNSKFLKNNDQKNEKRQVNAIYAHKKRLKAPGLAGGFQSCPIYGT